MLANSKKYIDKRDRRHTITDILIAFGFAFSFAITAYPQETMEILKHFGVLPPLATIIVAAIGVAARRYYSPQVLDANTTTTTTTTTDTLEVTKPMPETLSSDSIKDDLTQKTETSDTAKGAGQ